MEFYNNILCIPARDYYHEYEGKPGKSKVVEFHFVSYSTYCQQVNRNTLNILRQGKGEGNYALIELDSIPPKYRKEIYKKHPNPEKEARTTPLLDLLRPDYRALQFFTDFRYDDGSAIPTNKVDNIKLWSNNAAILNAISILWQKHITARAKAGKNPTPIHFFNNIATQLQSDAVYNRMPHNLPTSNRLRAKFKDYTKNSYASLIKNYKGNKNGEVITDQILYLLSCIATLPTRPYNTKVVDYYKEFMFGRIEIYDKQTGVQLMPEDFLDKNGQIAEFTEQAVWNKLNQPGTQVKLDKRRYGYKDFNDLHRPHRLRHLPNFSFSKISMDDRDLVFKDSTTKQRVKAYYAYDITSGCRIGSAYSMEKNEELFIDCLRDTFVFCERYGLGMPMEVEVEHHLVNKFFDMLGEIFPYMRICAPGNSQEKRAEHKNRYVKYQIEKNNHAGIGRWWLKSKYNRIGVDKIDDEFKEQMKPMERLIADDISDTIQYNNELHKDQEKYPNKTRLQVLLERVNPNLPKLDKAFLYKHIGEETKTSIVRSMYVSVQYAKYMLPAPQVLEKLATNNREVTAYWLPNDDGEIPEVHLYQNDKFICTCQKIATYNEAQAERTDEDWANKLIQDKYVAQFDKYAKAEDISKIEIIKATQDTEEPKPVEVMPDIPQKTELADVLEDDGENWAEKATADFFN